YSLTCGVMLGARAQACVPCEAFGATTTYVTPPERMTPARNARSSALLVYMVRPSASMAASAVVRGGRGLQVIWVRAARGRRGRRVLISLDGLLHLQTPLRGGHRVGLQLHLRGHQLAQLLQLLALLDGYGIAGLNRLHAA